MISVILLSKAAKVTKVARKTWKPLAALGAGWFIAHKTSERVKKAEKLLLVGFVGAVGAGYLIWKRRG
jgi:hypothetical protein